MVSRALFIFVYFRLRQECSSQIWVAARPEAMAEDLSEDCTKKKPVERDDMFTRAACRLARAELSCSSADAGMPGRTSRTCCRGIPHICHHRSRADMRCREICLRSSRRFCPLPDSWPAPVCRRGRGVFHECACWSSSPRSTIATRSLLSGDFS